MWKSATGRKVCAFFKETVSSCITTRWFAPSWSASVREPLPTRQPLRDFHPGLNFHSPPCHHVSIKPLENVECPTKVGYRLRPHTNARHQLSSSGDLYRQTLCISTQTLNLLPDTGSLKHPSSVFNGYYTRVRLSRIWHSLSRWDTLGETSQIKLFLVEPVTWLVFCCPLTSSLLPATLCVKQFTASTNLLVWMKKIESSQPWKDFEKVQT